MRTLSFLRAAFVIASVGGLTAAGASCAGKTVSLGTDTSGLSTVDPSSVTASSGAVPACGQGAAHPNVCCQAAQGTPSSCGVFPNSPFHACPAGWTTYPDPRSCCDLSNPASCAAPPFEPAPSVVACGYTCPPGWYSGGPNACCTTRPDGTGECFGVASGGTPPSGGTCTAGVPTLPDGGGPVPTFPDGGPINGVPDDAGLVCTPTPQPVPQPPTCTATCPPPFVRAEGVPDVCCKDDGNGVIECFSQAGGGPVPPGYPDGGAGWPTPTTPDGAVPTPVTPDGGVGKRCYGVAHTAGNACGCDLDSTTGAYYQLLCYDQTHSCQCVVSGAPSSGPIDIPNVPNACATQAALDSLWRDVCHFP
jgi:hypothetical protein